MDQCPVGSANEEVISSSRNPLNGSIVLDESILAFDPPMRSTPQKTARRSKTVPRIPLTKNVAEMVKNAEPDEKEIEEMFADAIHENDLSSEFDKAAVYEFLESKQKSKYLFDGVNMIKIKPRKNAAIKAMIGKAYYIKNRLSEKFDEKFTRRSTSRMSVGPAGPSGAACASGPADGKMGFLYEYVPHSGPKVPPLIENLVYEIEYRSKDMCEEGLYRLSGSSEQIKQLKRQLLANEQPNLQDHCIHNLTGVIKSFLRDLQEPLIPTDMWSDFVEMANIQCEQAKIELAKSLIHNLPKPNRDTLAFFIPHLQKVSDCPDAKMPLASMARVFAPTIIGYSTKEIGVELAETPMIIPVMAAILNLPTDFWEGLMNSEEACNVNEQ